MNHVENCVEDHVKYFKVCWKPYWKFQGLGRTAEKGMTWPWRDLLKRYFTELIQLKYKLILWIKTMGCCGLACVVWLKSCEFSKRKSVLIVGNSSMMCLLRKFLNLTYLWTFFIFYQTEWTCWVFLGGLSLHLNHLYSIAHDNLRLAIWDTSFWTFLVKFGHKGPWDVS